MLLEFGISIYYGKLLPLNILKATFSRSLKFEDLLFSNFAFRLNVENIYKLGVNCSKEEKERESRKVEHH